MKTLRAWSLYWGVWTLLGCYMAAVDVAQGLGGWRRSISGNLFQYLLWGLLALAARALLRRFPLVSGTNVRVWALHLCASFAITSLALLPDHFVFRSLALGRLVLPLSRQDWLGFLQSYRYQLLPNLLVYWAAVAGFLALEARRAAQESQLLAARLEAQLGQAQLQALRMQLNPHFLFNTLNAVASLIHSDPEAADRMLARMSGFLRLTLDAPPRPEQSLRQELVFLRSWLDIEQVRFRDRLRVDWQVPDALLEARVPALLLQPLVENALKHGLAGNEGRGTLSIQASLRGDRLRLEVVDDGPGCSPERLGAGVGTSNTQARLLQMYGDRHRFALEAVPGGGARTVVEIPFRREGDDPIQPEAIA